MLNFISANWATIVIGIMVFGLIALISIKMVSDKRKGKSSCGGGCSGCPNAQHCKTGTNTNQTFDDNHKFY